MSHPTETKDTLSWRQQINDMCWRRMRMRRSESQRKWRYCNTRKLKNARWTFKRKIKCWKYLSETFFVFRRMARETPDGVKYNCTTTEKYKKKQQGGRKKRRDPFHVAHKTRGKAERGVRSNSPPHTSPCQCWADSAMPSYSPAHFSTAAKRARTSGRKKEREVTTPWERKRKQGGDFCCHLSPFICCCWVSSHSSMFITSMGVGTKCWTPSPGSGPKAGVEPGPKPSEISKSQPIPHCSDVDIRYIYLLSPREHQITLKIWHTSSNKELRIPK